MSKRRLGLVLGVALALSACSGQREPGSGPGLAIEVAPLTLVGVADACYSIAVANEAGEPVVTRAGICASSYGAQGGVTYVAPCDATDTTGDDVAMNTVTLTIDGLYGPGPTDRLTDYVDPCAAPHAPGGCTLSARCVENADTLVAFDLTVMRQANQGFFDVAVTFEDIFCSAKVDCVDADGPLTLLHNPATEARDQTAVVALACTAGPDAAGTRLLRDPIQVVCADGTTALDPALGPGNAYGTGPGQVADPDPGDAVWQYAVYAGSEALDCGGQPCRKQYWNVAIGFSPSARDCRVVTTASAVDAGLELGFATPPGASYPIITYDVPLTTDAASPTLACSRHPLNGAPAGVATTYTGVGVARTFAARFEGQVLETGACPLGWTGPGCTTPVCTPACENGGTCEGPDACLCTADWTGPTCGTPVCDPACMNGGTCTAPDTCACSADWTGPTCETPVCDPACANGGTCTAPDTCACTADWTGPTCETPVCDPACMNGGTCTAPDTCACTADWTGSTCETPVCDPACQNDGACTAPDTCACTADWTGPTCETPVTPSVVTAGLVLDLDAGDATSYAGTGTTWTDLTAYPHDGALINGVTFSSAFEGGLVFNGTSQRVTVANAAALNPTAAVTVEAWVNATALANATHGDGVLSKGVASDGNAASYELMLVPVAGKNHALCRIYNGAARVYQPSLQPLELGTNYQLACTYDGSRLRLYVNGAEVGTGLATTGALEATSQPLSLGVRTVLADTAFDSNFTGTIYTGRVYGRALSATEIKTNFDALAPRYYHTEAPGFTGTGLQLDLDAGQVTSYRGAGTSWLDLSGNARHGTLVNGPTFAWLDHGAITFDGADDHVLTGGLTLTNSYSFELWFNPTSINASTLLSTPHYYADGYPGNFIVRLTNATTLDIATYNGRANEEWQPITVPTVPTNRWSHLVIANDGGALKLYLNGSQVGTSTINKALADAAYGLVVGDDISWTNQPFNGKIAQVRVYNRALTESEVLTSFRGTRQRFTLMLSFDFGRKPTLFPASATTARDLTGRGNNATLVNGAAYNTLGGGSLAFDGANDHATVGTTLANGYEALTVTAWFRQSTLLTGYYTQQTLVSADDTSSSGAEGVFALHIQSFDHTASLPSSFVGRHLVFGVRSASQSNRARALHIADNADWATYLPGLAIAKNPAELVAGEWLHVAGVYTGSETRLYLNGVLVASSTSQPDGVNRSVSGVLNTSSIQRTVGSIADGSWAFLPGNIRAVRVHRAALDATEIAAEFQALDPILNP